MGFKSWFDKAQEQRELARLRQLAQERPRARQQHYNFAHKMLPQIAFDFGAASVLLLLDPDKASGFLERVWRDCGQGLEGRDLVSPDGLSAGLSVETRRAKDQVISVVTLPAPQTTPEAFFVALMCDAVPEPHPDDDSSDAVALWKLLVRSTPVRVFTLELSQDLSGREHTVFCEWTSDGRHLNRGDGPRPDRNAFFSFLAAQEFPRAQASFDSKRDTPVQEGE
jgi:hypothetical protein